MPVLAVFVRVKVWELRIRTLERIVAVQPKRILFKVRMLEQLSDINANTLKLAPSSHTKSLGHLIVSGLIQFPLRGNNMKTQNHSSELDQMNAFSWNWISGSDLLERIGISNENALLLIYNTEMIMPYCLSTILKW